MLLGLPEEKGKNETSSSWYKLFNVTNLIRRRMNAQLVPLELSPIPSFSEIPEPYRNPNNVWNKLAWTFINEESNKGLRLVEHPQARNPVMWFETAHKISQSPLNRDFHKAAAIAWMLASCFISFHYE
jgi:hypothetical protein